MNKKQKKTTISFFEKVKKSTIGLVDKTMEEVKKSDTFKEVEEYAENAKSFMDENGITEALEGGSSKLKEFSDAAGEHLDQLSGKKIMEIVEQRLVGQTEYNDLLASKLEEALQRVAELEKVIGK